ncbi:MAG: DNA-directed polymerase, beta' subunit, partial [Dehalococcoidia bacterium]|nr:DNA-directed polymerase, beta' subunit [Dehalococcoidia bacterium]
MLDVNDFTAVRISLASPEQILNWSYGEVTKPETINYRTLKPEKDGLFCERIFGPTKDFECSCGKYKRVRYKGIVCDKCGVEVTRSKVRRERMGHIDLASPVGHVWFVKGAPSRVSILLDISPRSLERVTYFAQYIITKVDKDVVKDHRDKLEAEYKRTGADLEADLDQRVSQLKIALQEEEAVILEDLEAARVKLAEEQAALLDKIMQEADAFEALLINALGQPSAEELSLGGFTLVAKGETVVEAHVTGLKTVVEKQRSELEGRISQKRADTAVTLDAAIVVKREEILREIERFKKEAVQELSRLRQDMETELDGIDSLQPVKIIPEAKYRELREKYGSMFSAGMGAEAILEILRNMDLETIREQLQKEVQSASEQKRKKAIKRQRVVEAFRKSGNKPEWMVLTALPVLPPELRPMVQLDGGRFATSDLNDLYLRVINRNNRLKRLMDL